MKTKKCTGVSTSAIHTRQLAEIDLRLLARARFKPDRRPRRPLPRRAQRLERPLHLLIPAGEALRPQLAQQDDPIPADLGAAPLQERPVRVDRFRRTPAARAAATRRAAATA